MPARRPDSAGDAGLGKGVERLLLGRKALAQFVGIVVAQLVEREGEAVEEAQRLGHGLGRFGEQPRHLGAGLEVALGIGGEARPGRVERRALADAGQHVGERPPLGCVHGDVVGGDERQARAPRQGGARSASRAAGRGP